MNEGSAKQLEYRSGLCEKYFERSSSIVECAMFDASSRKIMFSDASATCCMAGATSKVSNELQFEEQVVCQDLIGELLSSFSETHDWKICDKCSLTTNQSHQHSCVVESVSCVDLYTIVSPSKFCLCN